MQKIKKEVPAQPVEPKKLERISSGDRPTVELTGQDGNVFNLIGLVSKALKKAGYGKHAKEMEERCFNSGDYDEVFAIFREYVIME